MSIKREDLSNSNQFPVQCANEQEKVCCRGCKEVVGRDNPLPKDYQINIASNVYYSMVTTSIHLGVGMSVFNCLFVVYRYYRKHDTGVNAMEVFRMLEYRGYIISYIVGRLRDLLDKGYIVVFGTGRNHSRLYIPSERIIKLFDERFGSIEVED